MEDLIKLRDKYMKVDCKELESLIEEHFEKIEERQKNQHRLNADLLEIDELESQLTILKNNHKREIEILANKSNEVSKLEEIVKELEIQCETVMSENRELESQMTQLSLKSINPSDLKKLDVGREKVSLYKKFTGIQWDYAEPGNTCKGFVTNGVDYIRGFKYPIPKDEKKLHKVVWDEIHSSTKKVEEK